MSPRADDFGRRQFRTRLRASAKPQLAAQATSEDDTGLHVSRTIVSERAKDTGRFKLPVTLPLAVAPGAPGLVAVSLRVAGSRRWSQLASANTATPVAPLLRKSWRSPLSPLHCVDGFPHAIHERTPRTCGGVRHRACRGLHCGALHTMPAVFLRLLRDPSPQVHKHLGDVDGGGADLVAGPAQGSAYAGAARSARLAV